MNSPVFVVGSPRSGTSYLSRALGLAENTCYLGESALFCLVGARSDFAEYHQRMVSERAFPYHRGLARLLRLTDRARKKNRVRDAVEHMLLMSKVESYDLNRSDTLYKAKGITLDDMERRELNDLSQTMFVTLDAKGVAEFAKEYLEEYAQRKGCEIVVEKTPTHLRYLPLIHAVFPDAKVILIRRDKEKCLESYSRTFGRGLGMLRYLPAPITRGIIRKQLRADVIREEWAMKQPWVKTIGFDEFVKNLAELIKQLEE